MILILPNTNPIHKPTVPPIMAPIFILSNVEGSIIIMRKERNKGPHTHRIFSFLVRPAVIGSVVRFTGQLTKWSLKSKVHNESYFYNHSGCKLDFLWIVLLQWKKKWGAEPIRKVLKWGDLLALFITAFVAVVWYFVSLILQLSMLFTFASPTGNSFYALRELLQSIVSKM